VVGLALLAVTEILGPQDPLVAGSRALAIFERVQEAAGVAPEKRVVSQHAPAAATAPARPARPSDRGGESAP